LTHAPTDIERFRKLLGFRRHLKKKIKIKNQNQVETG